MEMPYELLVDKVEEVTPVPGVILDHPVRIELDPQVEEDEANANGPTHGANDEALVLRLVTADDGEQAVGNEVTHEDEVNNATEGQPGVVLHGGLVELVVFGNLGLELTLEGVVQPRPGLFAIRR
ncbi:hypothetical protein HYQ46_003879 [Verticillium longisporum]|nr:hypothetical protein HYQ46_003879 [Verticillium longisporum]